MSTRITERNTSTRVGVLIPESNLPRWQIALLQELETAPGIELVRLPIADPTRSSLSEWLWRSVVSRAVAPLRPCFVQSGTVRHVGRLTILLDLSRSDIAEVMARQMNVPLWRIWADRSRRLQDPFPFLEVAHCLGYTAKLEIVETRPTGGPALVLAAVHLEACGHTYPWLLAFSYKKAGWIVACALGHDEDAAVSIAPSPPARVLQIAVLVFRALRVRVGSLLREAFFREDWRPGLLDFPIEAVLDRKTDDAINQITWLTQPPGAFYWADPFGFPGARDRILCEMLPRRTNRGSIVGLRVKDNQAEPVGQVDFGLTCHLSYPFLFKDGSDIYCIPESAAAGYVTIFRCTGTPEQWVELAVAVREVRAADPTLFRHGNLYWLAFTDIDISPFNNLCLFFAERLGGPWQRHNTYPVKIDVRSARPGGTPFIESGRLYRPAQDCSRGYGCAVSINRVLVCTPSKFREEVVKVILPDPTGPFSSGLHTLASWDNRTLVDGKRYLFDPLLLPVKVARRTRRLLTID